MATARRSRSGLTEPQALSKKFTSTQVCTRLWTHSAAGGGTSFARRAQLDAVVMLGLSRSPELVGLLDLALHLAAEVQASRAEAQCKSQAHRSSDCNGGDCANTESLTGLTIGRRCGWQRRRVWWLRRRAWQRRRCRRPWRSGGKVVPRVAGPECVDVKPEPVDPLFCSRWIVLVFRAT